MDKQRRFEITASLIKTPEGRARYAASLTQPLRKRRDYQSVGRKAFYVEQLPDGALPIYDKDAQVTAYLVGEEGMNIVSVQKPKRITFDLFEIVANPEIPLTEVKAKRFDLLERSIDYGKAMIGAEEDRKVFATMEALAQDPTAPNATINVTGNMTANAIVDAWGQVTRNDIRVQNIFMNAIDYKDILKFDRDVLDPVMQGTMFKTAIVGSMYGANIVVSRIVPEGSVYVCGEPEFFGRIPVRTDLTVISADDPKNRMVGFSMFEQLGIGLYNGLAMAKIDITRV